MKYSALLLAAMVLAAAPLFAEGGTGFALSGDLDAQAIYNDRNSASVFPSLPEMTAGGLIDGKLAFSRQYTTLGLLDFTFQETNVIDHVSGAKVESLSFLVNEMYSDLNFGDLLYLRLGKQRLKWGAGFIFNPSDPVNPPKDPTALRAVREGVTALKAELITKGLSVMGFGVFYDALGQTGLGSKISTSALPGADIALSGYWSPSESWTAAFNTSVAPLYETPGWDTLQLWFEGSLSDKGRYAAFSEGSIPGAVAPVTATGLQYSLLVGASGTLPEIRTVVLAEYYHLSEGLTQGQLGAVYGALRSPDPAVVAQSSGWLAELARRPGRQGADYLFVSLTQPSLTDNGDPVFDKIGLTASCLANLTDLSFFATGGITTTFVKDSEVDLTVSWAHGSECSEFGSVPAALAVTLEVKVFF
ncbi:MAG: hypothetical protein ABSG63_15345 [Spirochaetia bacterium]